MKGGKFNARAEGAHGPSRPRGLLANSCFRPVVRCRAPRSGGLAGSALGTRDPGIPPVQVSGRDTSWFLHEQGQKKWVEAMELDTIANDMPAMLIQLGVKYDPEILASMFSERRGDVYSRAVQIAGAVGLFISSLGSDWATGSLQQKYQQRGAQLSAMLSDLGPSFVKVGQALSLRPDLLPKPYLDALSSLQDGLPAFPSSIAFAVIEEELGRPLETVFSHITEEPVAAASLGQVYKATLASDGSTVAVKVQRPGIGQSIAVDMLLLRRLLEAVDRLQDVISQPLVPLVDEFAARLFGELDYLQEGRNCERFTELYKEVPRVITPSIFWECTSRRVLTMEWIEGVKLTNGPAMEAAGLQITDYVDIGVECTLRQLLEAGLFHADPHPGNLLATKSGDLAYLDFGMMSEAPEYARYAIIAHVVHLVNRDYAAMCKDYYTLQFMDPSVDTSPIAPALAAFFDDVLENSVSKLNFKAIVDGLGAVLFEYPFQVPAYYALILRSLTVLEGVALSADPRYKLLAKAYPYMARRLLTDPAPELRATFEELMLMDGRFRWNRLINLLEQSQKSQDFSNDKLWLIAEWFLSDAGARIRTQVVEDIVRMTDAKMAESVRSRLAASTGSMDLAQRMVPFAKNEQQYVDTADQLEGALSSRGQTLSLVPSGGLPESGFPSREEVQQLATHWQTQLRETWPRLQGLASHPSVSQMTADFVSHIGRRVLARSLKFVFANQEASA